MMGKTTFDDDDVDLLPFICEVILIQILVCLPVKSLLQFKSVCKSWHELIHSSFFIDLHTTFNNSSSKFGAFILQSDGSRKNINIIISDGGGTGEMMFKLDNLGFLPFYKDFMLTHTILMVGSCNGIICLHDPMLLDDSKGIDRQDYTNLRDVFLWNPATRQFRILPKSIPIEEKKRYMGNWLEDFITFGFDIKTKDYKVLRITPWEELYEGGCICRAQVYSLSTDSWRLLEGINSLPILPNQSICSDIGIYLNGSYFFDFMLSFDFTKEIFTSKFRFPGCYGIIGRNVYLGDKVAVFTRSGVNGRESGYEYYDIRVLNEKPNSIMESSWTKLHSFRIKSSGETLDFIEPKCISNNGEFALLSTGRTDDSRNKLQLYNLVTKEAKMDFTIGFGHCRADVYQESLVSIFGDNS